MDIDYQLLSRLGFAWTASYHIIFPSLLIGFGFFLSAMEALWLTTGRTFYREQYQFWLKLFTVAFVVAVLTGVGLSYQLDTHFGHFYHTTTDILAPIRMVELVNAIVLEAGSLGIMLWGWRLVGKKLHFIATLMMNAGLIISLMCIIARNSWMQTPDGFIISDGQIMLDDWLSAIFSPSFPYRLTHMLFAGLLSSACFMAAISAIYLLRRSHIRFAKFNLRIAIITILTVSPLQILIGDLHGLNTFEYQPAKIAAIEGIWETRQGAPLILLGRVNQAEQSTDSYLSIPKLASLILTHDVNGEIRGMKSFSEQNRPDMAIIFYSFRIMVASGLWMLALAIIGFMLLIRSRIDANRMFLRICVASMLTGFIATIAGWLVSEAGRQPWAVYELIRTHELLQPIGRHEAMQTLLLLGFVDVVSLAGFIYAITRIIKKGPVICSDHIVNKQNAVLPAMVSD